jgi:hypothetical protein
MVLVCAALCCAHMCACWHGVLAGVAACHWHVNATRLVGAVWLFLFLCCAAVVVSACCAIISASCILCSVCFYFLFSIETRCGNQSKQDMCWAIAAACVLAPLSLLRSKDPA